MDLSRRSPRRLGAAAFAAQSSVRPAFGAKSAVIMAMPESRIGFEVQTPGGAPLVGRLELVVDGQLLLRLDEFPLTHLAEQLEAWAEAVDDGPNCRAFHFVLDGPRHLSGAFRIEPRPEQWQFTSQYETGRHARLMGIDEVKGLVRTFVRGMKEAGGAA
jgi:hypothetical protein